MVTETYAHVHHIVSNVQGRLREGVTPIRRCARCFPGGTITGCPKMRCMQIIAELEGRGRGAYYGSLGYLNRDGSGDFNILIRTISVHGSAITAAHRRWHRRRFATRRRNSPRPAPRPRGCCRALDAA